VSALLIGEQIYGETDMLLFIYLHMLWIYRIYDIYAVLDGYI
jgi:hypothetical protein